MTRIKAFSEGFGWVSPEGEIYPIDDLTYSTHYEYVMANPGLFNITNTQGDLTVKALENGWFRYILSGYGDCLFEYSENNPNLEHQLVSLINHFKLKSNHTVWANNKKFDNLNSFLEYAYKGGKVFSNQPDLQGFINQNNIKYIYDVKNKNLYSFPTNKSISKKMEYAIAQMEDAWLISDEILNETEFTEWYLEEYGNNKLPYKILWDKVHTNDFKPIGFSFLKVKNKPYFAHEDSIYYGRVVKDEYDNISFKYDGTKYLIYS